MEGQLSVSVNALKLFGLKFVSMLYRIMKDLLQELKSPWF